MIQTSKEMSISKAFASWI